MLSSFLLSKSALEGKKTKVDDALDAIFSTSVNKKARDRRGGPLTAKVDLQVKSEAPLPKPVPISIFQALSPHSIKRKRNDDIPAAADGRSKRRKPSPGGEATTSVVVNHEPSRMLKSKQKESKRVGNRRNSSSGEDGIEQLEEKYSKQRLTSPPLNGKQKKKGKKSKSISPPDTAATTSKPNPGMNSSSLGDSTSDDEGPSTLVHETVTSENQPPKRRKAVYVPEDETKEQRNQRTIFIGNLPVDIVKTKSLQKSLRRFILSFCPTSTDEAKFKIESIRFRSVAFKAPTNPQALKEGNNEPESTRRQERAATWKMGQKEAEPMDEDAPKPIEYLTPSEKKRIAFIKGDFHDEATSVNAYVVFAHPDPESSDKIMDPFKAAALVVERMNGEVFGARTLRVDLAHKGDSGSISTIRNPTTTIFVGSLDFNADEESLRSFFETLLTAEMGPPRQNKHGKEDSDDSDEEEDASMGAGEKNGSSRWVDDVRIIRDKDTQLGKGFAYVRFSERTCVDEILAMDGSKLKFAKRKLRVEKCKGGEASKGAPKQSKGPGKSSMRDAATIEPGSKPSKTKPKGDPLLGERLKGLSKEERREIKKSDPTRQARRMEKKKAKFALEKGMTAVSKERVRVRKVKNPGKVKSKQN